MWDRTKPNRQVSYQGAAFSRADTAAKLMPGLSPCRFLPSPPTE
jgi:hypothetical protein